MIKKGMNKQEILDVLKDKGDFVKIDYILRFLKQEPPFETKRFLYVIMAEIYEKKGVYFEVAKMYHNAAAASIKFTDKIKMHVKEAEAFIKFGDFVRADGAMKNAFSEANASQKAEIYFEIKEFYKKQAEVYLKNGKKNKAMRIYEKLMEMNLPDPEKIEMREKLNSLYEQLGKIQDIYKLRGKGF